MSLCLTLGWVITTRADLEGEVETMLLLFRLEHLDQVKTTLAQKHVATVTQVASPQSWTRFVERRNNTGRTTNFVISCHGLHQKLLRRFNKLLFVVSHQLVDVLAEALAEVSGVNAGLGPTTDSVSYSEHILRKVCCVLASLLDLLEVRLHPHTCVKNIDL